MQEVRIIGQGTEQSSLQLFGIHLYGQSICSAENSLVLFQNIFDLTDGEEFSTVPADGNNSGWRRTSYTADKEGFHVIAQEVVPKP